VNINIRYIVNNPLGSPIINDRDNIKRVYIVRCTPDESTYEEITVASRVGRWKLKTIAKPVDADEEEEDIFRSAIQNKHTREAESDVEIIDAERKSKPTEGRGS